MLRRSVSSRAAVFALLCLVAASLTVKAPSLSRPGLPFSSSMTRTILAPMKSPRQAFRGAGFALFAAKGSTTAGMTCSVTDDFIAFSVQSGRFRSPSGATTLTLLPMVHVAPPSFYRAVLEAAEEERSAVVLYELLVPESLRRPSELSSLSPTVGHLAASVVPAPGQETAPSPLVSQLEALDFHGLQQNEPSRWHVCDQLKEQLEDDRSPPKSSPLPSFSFSLPSLLPSPPPSLSPTFLPRSFFLPGIGALYNPVKLLAWFLLPSPELTALLLDSVLIAETRPRDEKG